MEKGLPNTEPSPLLPAAAESGRQWLAVADSGLNLALVMAERQFRVSAHVAKWRTVPIGFREPIFRRHRALLI
jgi:hypothetical protein